MLKVDFYSTDKYLLGKIFVFVRDYFLYTPLKLYKFGQKKE